MRNTGTWGRPRSMDKAIGCLSDELSFLSHHTCAATADSPCVSSIELRVTILENSPELTRIFTLQSSSGNFPFHLIFRVSVSVRLGPHDVSSNCARLLVIARGRMGSSYAAVKDESEGSGDEKPETGQFSEGEKVLAYHGPLIYDTKILKAEYRKREWKYFVHYLGWSKNWDEWVGADRLMKPTEENLERQKKLQTGDKQSKGRVPAGKQKSAAEKELKTENKSKKRKSETVVEAVTKDSDESDHLLKISLPGTLKKQLVEDWEFITQMGKVVTLPRSPSAEEIFKKYIDFKTKRDGAIEDSLVEVLNGLRSYFDKALSAMLLYPQERAQYASVVPQGSNVSPSSIYGAEHLLRLFVKLSELLVHINMEHEALTQLQHKLGDFLKFLQRNQSNFFLTSYG